MLFICISRKKSVILRANLIKMSKTLYIIAGCNGAGKTTASFTILPEIWHCREFVNADEIARGLSPLNPNSMAIPAGRIMLQRIDVEAYVKQ